MVAAGGWRNAGVLNVRSPRRAVMRTLATEARAKRTFIGMVFLLVEGDRTIPCAFTATYSIDVRFRSARNKEAKTANLHRGA
jgi:hypothetical protein